MPTLLRSFLIRLLLVAVFFNAVIGMPSHEAQHLSQESAVSSAAVSASQASEEADVSRETTELHGACAWCLAHAHLSIGLAPSPTASAGLPPSGLLLPPAPETFIADSGRWPFASRDPPHDLG